MYVCATDINNIAKYTALTDSAMPLAEAWSSLRCLNASNVAQLPLSNKAV